MTAVIGGGVATLLSLMVLSRAIADNPLYRFAQYLLIGVALGYVAAVLVNQALLPPVFAVANQQATPQTILILTVTAVLALLLITRFGKQRASALANIPLAIVFGVGAAIALLGAIRGTIVPQLLDTIALRRLATPDIATLLGTIVLLITLSITLLSFTYVQRHEQPSRMTQTIRRTGRFLILATFGVFLAAAVTTYITAIVNQIQMIADWIVLVLGLF
jgi:hypothetical protein